MVYWRTKSGRGVVTYTECCRRLSPARGGGKGTGGLIFSCGESIRKILIDFVFSKYIRWNVIHIKTTSA